MASQRSIDDCYFYYYSSCNKGDMCPFRHCESALGTETVCSLWKEARCFKNNCKFRHMESRIKRATIPCYWENQPSGCRKPHCVFYHRKLKNGMNSVKENSGLILPLSNGPAPSNSPTTLEESDLKISPRSSPRIDTLNEFIPDSTSVPVTPIVVSFDEESDNESVSSTPIKMSSESVVSNQLGSAKSNILSKLSGASEKTDFGVKTLEQIKMEKIHKESEHFYKSEYDAPVLTVSQITQKVKNEGYPPQSEFISVSSDASNDKNLFLSTNETALQELEKESDSRERFSKWSTFSTPKAASDKRMINFKKQNNKTEMVSDSLNFKIKTLDEIRRERESKQGIKTDNVSRDNSSTNAVKDSRILNQGFSQKPTKRLKITRKSTELSTKSAFSTKGGGDSFISDSDILIETKPQLILHEVRANNQTELKETMDYTASIRITLGKRKDSEDTEIGVKSKILKTNAELMNESRLANGINAAEKQVAKGLRPFLRRLPPTKAPETVEPKPSADVDAAVVNSGFMEASESITDLKDAEREMVNEDCWISSTTAEADCEIPSTPTEQEKPRSKSLSLDEFEDFLNEADMTVDDVNDVESAGGDDILLEIEQFLDS